MTEQLIGGRYRIVRMLAAGGMGEVFLAENVPLGRFEVLKVLSKRLAAEQRFVARFRREARATERLQHPNIVAVLGSGEMADGRHFLALEFVEGETLEETLAREAPLPLPLAQSYIEQLADAIGYGHACGVIHRDIKPGNLIRLKDRPRTIKVLDFGLAKIVHHEVEESLITPHGLALGTPPYMAPEQLTGAPVGPWTDVYAIGCVAFELLAGRPPFTGSQSDIMRQQVMDPPPTLRRIRRGQVVPSPLEAVIMQCLQKEPSRRPPDATVIVDELRGMHTLVTEHRPLDDDRTLRDAVPVAMAGRGGSADPRDSDPYHQALCNLAAALLDCGENDPDLTLALAEASDLAPQLARVETALRGARKRPSAEVEIKDLEATCAERRSTLAAVHHQLEELIASLSTRFAHVPMVARLTGELAVVRKRKMLE